MSSRPDATTTFPSLDHFLFLSLCQPTFQRVQLDISRKHLNIKVIVLCVCIHRQKYVMQRRNTKKSGFSYFRVDETKTLEFLDFSAYFLF